MNNPDVYERLADWYGTRGMLRTEEAIPILKAMFTSEEAALLVGIPFSAKSLHELAELKHMDPAELKPQLDALARKGVIFRVIAGGTIQYTLNNSSFSIFRSAFWPGTPDGRSKALAPLANKYYYRGAFGGQTKSARLKGLRTLPINETIRDTRQILPYEEVVKVLESKEYFAVAHCPCRTRKNLDPAFPDCPHSTEVCLHFDGMARYIVENGLGKEITREETRDILQLCAEEGLVHGISNIQEGGDTICNCCKCCCLFFEAYHKLGHAGALSPSNYLARTNPELCIGCGLCVDRCPMEAIHLIDSPEVKNRVTKVNQATWKVRELKNQTGKLAAVNTEVCIGCGVCAYKCSTKSLVLDWRSIIVHPPKDRHEFARMVKEEKEPSQAIR